MSGFNVVFGVDPKCFALCVVGGSMACKESGLIFHKRSETSLVLVQAAPMPELESLQSRKLAQITTAMNAVGVEVTDER